MKEARAKNGPGEGAKGEGRRRKVKEVFKKNLVNNRSFFFFLSFTPTPCARARLRVNACVCEGW